MGKTIFIVILICFIVGIAGAEKYRLGDVAEYQTVLNDTIAADTQRTGSLLRIDHDSGPPPAYLTMQVHLQGSGVALCGYMVTGEDSTYLGPQISAVNDTVWFLGRGHARADTGWFAVTCDVTGLRYCRAVFVNSGTGTATVRARVWRKSEI